MNKKIIKLILSFGIILSFVISTYSGYIKAELAAILVALTLGMLGIFRDWIRSQFFYPELEIEFNVNPPDCHKTFLTYRYKESHVAPGITMPGGSNREKQWRVANVECYYYRLKILNKGNSRAKKIEVIAKEKYSQNSEGRLVRDKNFLPLNLKWSHDGVIIRESIAPSLSRHCDFGRIISPASTHISFPDGRVYEHGVVLDLDLEVKPNTMSNLIFPGKHRLKIIAVADNSKAVSKIFEIEFNDFWDDNEEIMLRDGLTVREVTSFT